MMQNSQPNAVERNVAFRELVKCPHCLAANTLMLSSSPVVCVSCGAIFSCADDIVDFVAGRDNTRLNVVAYDNQKNVSAERSLALFHHLRSVFGTLLPNEFGKILEIGAGTGLLTLGMLAVSKFSSAVVTDISPEMLRVCRARLEQYSDADKWSRVLFATYSGKEDIFADGAFDLCIANSVVHHILDYYRFFADVRRALNPTGTAVFVEPGAPFHNALTLALNDTLVAMIAEGSRIGDADLNSVARWAVETRSGLIFPDADKATKEDKHVFSRDDLELAARSAGFADLTVLPWERDPIGLKTLNSYLGGLGVSNQFRESVFPKFTRIAEHHFRHLADQDKTSMYVIGLHCSRERVNARKSV